PPQQRQHEEQAAERGQAHGGDQLRDVRDAGDPVDDPDAGRERRPHRDGEAEHRGAQRPHPGAAPPRPQVAQLVQEDDREHDRAERERDVHDHRGSPSGREPPTSTVRARSATRTAEKVRPDRAAARPPRPALARPPPAELDHRGPAPCRSAGVVGNVRADWRLGAGNGGAWQPKPTSPPGPPASGGPWEPPRSSSWSSPPPRRSWPWRAPSPCRWGWATGRGSPAP